MTYNIITISSTTDILNALKESDHYDGFFYTGTELNPTVRELLLLATQTSYTTHVIGFNQSIIDDPNFIELMNDYIESKDIILINKPVSEFTTEELVLLEDDLSKLKIVKQETHPAYKPSTFTNILPHREEQGFKEGLTKMFNRKYNKRFR